MKVLRCLYCDHDTLSSVTHRSDNNEILRCARCKVMMVENINDDTESLYTADYFEKAEGTKNGYTNYLSSPVVNLIGKFGFSRLFARELGVHLDLGCADGSLIEIFNSAGFVSSGLEISKDAVAIAKSKGLDVKFSTLHSFPAGLQKSTVITAFDLLEHADRPGAVLKEVYENLEDDGYFVFSTLCVKRTDPSDYWFNNSLEHYVYYDQKSLEFIMTEVFGEGRFAFVEIEINGVAEFWGFGKKGEVKSEHKIISNIASGGFDKKDTEAGYFVSLFYDQLSKFSESQKVIDFFAERWASQQLFLARFYNAFYQGRYEYALELVGAENNFISANNSVYWQALAFVREQYFIIRQRDVASEYETEINRLRAELFTIRDELYGIKSSRSIGQAIELRNRLNRGANRFGKGLVASVDAPGRLAHGIRVIGAPLVPGLARKSIKRSIHRLRSVQFKRPVTSKVSSKPALETAFTEIDNKQLDGESPLVSVVIPYYNRADTIDDTLESLRKQTFKDFEVILVDDGSPEKRSITKLKNLNLKGLDARVVSQANQGVAMARNNGIAMSGGEYVICLDSDDMLAPTYIEKAVYVLETQPDVSVVSSHMSIFGSVNDNYKNADYSPLELYSDNMVITAAAFRRSVWAIADGYKSNIGYEDWEFWLNLAEHGFWGRRIPEELFLYRTSLQSRFIADKDVHWNSLKRLRALHPAYAKKVKKLLNSRAGIQTLVTPDSAFVNLSRSKQFAQSRSKRLKVMITMPWMTFGGAETLIHNYCKEISSDIDITFVTGLQSDHEWEYKFQQITPNIYHLPNIFSDPRLYVEFVSNYIATRNIDVLHLVHNGFMFEMLPTLKERHPDLKIILTLFNDRVPQYVAGAVDYQEYIDQYVTDNVAVAKSLSKKMSKRNAVSVIPNGIDAYNEFNATLFNRSAERKKMGLKTHDIAVFFVGRLSEEKNPDVFIRAARLAINTSKKKNLKFFLIGDGVMRQEVELLIDNDGSDDITWLGYQSEVGRYLSAADIFVLPSSIEGFPLSILEAMAMGVAVVASNVGAVAEVIDTGKDGYVVKPGSADEIAQKVISLAEDPAKLDAMKAVGRKKVEQKYSNRILGANYRNLYEDITK
jgi:glycosyltransferase involved in cell wall biosynthesis/SAM-dependent methyltransferase